MPLLALCYVWRNFSTSFFCNLTEFLFGLITNDRSERQGDLGKEIHVLSCASKPVSSWTTQQVIQECREACGGHGYLKSSRFGDMRNNNDPLLTFEGDNNVLLQQTSNSLISSYSDYLKTRVVHETPLKTTEFLRNFDAVMASKFAATTRQELLTQSTIMEMFNWLLCFTLKNAHDKLENGLMIKKGQFQSRNDNQAYSSKTLAIIFIEREVIARFIDKLNENNDPSLQPALNRILYLAALYFMDKNLVLFYQGGYFSNKSNVSLIRDTILDLCVEIKDDSIGLIDAIAPPDYVLNSSLGYSTGNVYQNLYSSMIQSNGSFERIGDLESYLTKTEFASRKSKL